ncbi:MAG: hypothetical protein HRF45_09425 [Fimbriimonadia bacterium]|jgi:hypothetical protein
MRGTSGVTGILGLLALGLACNAGAQVYRNLSDVPFATVSDGPQQAIVVDVDGLDPAQVRAKVVERVQIVQRAMTEAGRPLIRELKARGLMPRDMVWPVTHVVLLRENGRLLLPRSNGSLPPSGEGVSIQNGCLSLQFSTAQGETFTSQYQAVLQGVFDTANPLIEGIYGAPYPAACGPITVVNYDADIGDRDAVVGGIYLASDPTHGGGPTILFPVYNNLAAAAVNFLNLLVHAYHGPAMLHFDAWEQGFSRAVTMRVARQVYPDTFTFPDGSRAGPVLEATYEARSFYDWWNQPALGNNSFIAPSLKNAPINPGFTGGLFLVRYMMAGSAWAKVLTEDPAFFTKFHAAYYADPDPPANLAGNVPTLKTIAAAATPEVEGLPFASWFHRQHILNSSVQVGRKLHSQVIPLCGGLQPGETGVFIILYNYFNTSKSGDESLLNGISFPIYWTFDFARMNLGAQYERVNLLGGSAGLAPSFTDSTQAVTIDTPVAETLSRVVLPIGTVCTQTLGNDFYGTVLGLSDYDPVTGLGGTVTLKLPTGDVTANVVRGAFGAQVPTLTAPQRATVEVRDRSGTLLATRKVNTGAAPLALSLQVTEQGTHAQRISDGIQMITVPIWPSETDTAILLGMPPGEMLFARWRQDLFRYTLYPATPPIQPGYAFFVKLPLARDVTFTGTRPPADRAFAVPLQVGWNQIGNPIRATGATSLADVWVQSGPNDPAIGWDEAVTKGWVSPTVFRFDRDISNPDAGTNQPATAVEALKGYWVRVRAPEGVTILFRPNSGLGPVAPYRSRTPSWHVDVTIRAENGSTAEARLGADPTASDRADPQWDTPLPPAFGPGLQLSFPHPEWGADKGDYYSDVRADRRQSEWTLRASGLTPDTTYTLTWDVSATMRREMRLTLTDPRTGRVVNMRGSASLTFTASDAEQMFVIRAETSGAGALRVTDLNVQTTRGGCSATFAVSQAAGVSVEVLSVGGGRVRSLAEHKPFEAGLHTVTWDGRDERGVSLPPGVYVLSVQAVGEDGTVARAVRPLVLKR